MASALVPTNFLGVDRLRQYHRQQLVHRQMGHLAVARRAGARQHRIDGRDGKMTALISATKSLLTQLQNRRHRRRRRLCVDHSVREGRQPRRRQLEFRLHLLGHFGAGCLAVRRQFLGRQQRNLPDSGGAVIGNYNRPQLMLATRSPARFPATRVRTAAPARALARSRAITLRAAARVLALARYRATLAKTAAPAPAPALSRATPARIAARVQEPVRYRATTARTAARVLASAQSRNIRRAGSCSQHNGTWTAGQWTAGTWTAATWTATPGTWTAGVWSKTTTKWVPDAHSTWNGCVMDRGNSTTPDTVNNYDTNAAGTSVSINSSLYPAEQYSSCPQAVMGLSYDWSAMTTLVNNMSPNGNTNQAHRIATRLDVAGRRRTV